ncbi:hypothetical protein KC19_9G033200 [Ceratodon purpureus]|uniref:Uncharacterized protein n=1 Tax=Ceratodon purpureus TaxID=3225 RepID=A0A8T0GPV6_CERPU|nr:hypothetical protein KC19_9G033200 [Ceratodon purpureus]
METHSTFQSDNCTCNIFPNSDNPLAAPPQYPHSQIDHSCSFESPPATATASNPTSPQAHHMQTHSHHRISTDSVHNQAQQFLRNNMSRSSSESETRCLELLRAVKNR